MAAGARRPRHTALLLVLGLTAAAAPPPAAAGTQSAAVRGLLQRLLPPHVAAQIELEHQPLSAPELAAGLTDYFELAPADASAPTDASSAAVVRVRGSSGVAMGEPTRGTPSPQLDFQGYT